MNPLDWLLTAAVALCLILAVRKILRDRKKGGCCGCSGSCAGCSHGGCSRR